MGQDHIYAGSVDHAPMREFVVDAMRSLRRATSPFDFLLDRWERMT